MNQLVESQKPMQEARIRTMNGLIPVKNIEPYMKGDAFDIWKGEIVKDTEQADTLGKFIFFDRHHDPDRSDIDKWSREYSFVDKTPLAFSLWLIPKEKCMFVLDPASEIILIPRRDFKKKKRTQ